MTQPAKPEKPHTGSAGARPPESLAQLAAKQGVQPADDLDHLAALWPADDNPDELDAFIQEQRTARRSAVRAKP